MSKPTRVQEVDAVLKRERVENVPIETYHKLTRTLAAEVDELRRKIDDIRSGSALRACRSEASKRGAIITKLLVMMKPGTKPKIDRCNDDTWHSWQQLDRLYARACEIAGRAE